MEQFHANDKDGRTAPLHNAWIGHVEMMRRLANRFDADVNFKDKNGQTLLHLSIRHKIANIRSDPNSDDIGEQTPLTIAIDAEHSEIIYFIINRTVLNL